MGFYVEIHTHTDIYTLKNDKKRIYLLFSLKLYVLMKYSYDMINFRTFRKMHD